MTEEEDREFYGPMYPLYLKNIETMILGKLAEAVNIELANPKPLSKYTDLYLPTRDERDEDVVSEHSDASK